MKCKYANYHCWSAVTYYRCENRKTITEKVIEKELLSCVRSELEKYIINYDVEVQKRKDVGGKIKALEDKIKRLKDLYVNGIITIEELKSDMDKYQSEIDNLRAESMRPERDLSELKQLLNDDFEEIYKTLSSSEKRQLWHSILKEIRFDKDRKLSFVFL